MALYRIFTNDRGSQRVGGLKTPMYSAWKEVVASSAKEALKKCPPQFDYPNFAPAVAINWRNRSKGEKAWLKKHVVGEPL